MTCCSSNVVPVFHMSRHYATCNLQYAHRGRTSVRAAESSSKGVRCVDIEHIVFLFWMQRGHKLTSRDLWEVADLVCDSDLHCAHIVHMLKSS